MVGKKKQKNSVPSFRSENYQLKDHYNSNNLIVANLEYISSTPTMFGPKVKTTKQRYIFEKITNNEKTRYREVFTGFIADSDESHYFDLPYVINIESLEEVFPSVASTIPKYGLLLVLDEVNKQELTKKKGK